MFTVLIDTGSETWNGAFSFRISDPSITIQWKTTESTSTLNMTEDFVAKGILTDDSGTGITSAIFTTSITGPATNTFQSIDLGNGEYELILSQTDVTNTTYKVLITIEALNQSIDIRFTFTRISEDDNKQTASGNAPPDLIPGFEIYLGLLAVVTIPIIRRKKSF